MRAVLAAEAPKIDGVLDEAVWQSAIPIDTFVQQEPLEGQPASDRTEVRILYDQGHLFIGVHAYASLSVIATEMRRDADRLFDEDNFQVILDTFHDSRNAFMFLTTPLGAKLEQQVFDEGEGGGRGTTSNVNRNWDGVWDAAARITQDGWTAEISIPVNTLRFTKGDAPVWGINFERHIRRKNETVFWAPIPKAYGLTRVSLAGELTGLSGLSLGWDLKLKPFLVGGVHDVKTSRTVGVDLGDPRHRLRRALRRHGGSQPRRHRQHRLRAGRGRRAAGQPHALRSLLSREARFLSRELEPVHRRHRQFVHVNAGPDRPLLQPPHRVVGYRHAHSDHRRRAPCG